MSGATKRGVASKRDRVRRAVISRLVEGRLGVGGRIASERELARDLGVSRGTLREALKELEAEGIITRRRGSGTYLHRKGTIPLGILITSMTKPVDRHLVGAVRARVERSGLDVQLDIIREKSIDYFQERERFFVGLLTRERPATFFKVPEVHLERLARMELVEDLSGTFADWPERDNIFPVTRRSITVGRGVLVLPYPCGEFDTFLLSVHRVLSSPGVEPAEEYDFFRSMEAGGVRLEFPQAVAVE